MIGYVRGQVKYIYDEYCLIDVNGIGYRLFISGLTQRTLKISMEVELFTYLHVREDIMTLYGFHSKDEYDMFILLTSVSGIGPKAGMGILSAMTPEQLRIAIGLKNLTALTKIPGIGKKTAERLILELKDKIKISDSVASDDIDISIDQGSRSIRSEAVEALTSLGYSATEAEERIKKLGKIDNMKLEDIIKAALKASLGR